MMMRVYHILDTGPGALGCSASGCSITLPSSYFRLRDNASDSSDGENPKVPPLLSTHPGLGPVYAESFCLQETRGVDTTRLSLYKRAQGTKKEPLTGDMAVTGQSLNKNPGLSKTTLGLSAHGALSPSTCLLAEK